MISQHAGDGDVADSPATHGVLVELHDPDRPALCIQRYQQHAGVAVSDEDPALGGIGGRIVEMGSVREVLLAPRHAVTRRLIAAADLRAVTAATTNTSSRLVR